ncbi:hypothetical protein Ahy_A07g034953 [Arachis hypogaea]|uniref:Aminotransferase-like plant mobile domain-containing protein n=1 Tax=Arachis hypogaea TaxID=3818 RepID=A0A445CD42_ARAHY|nr:hypothetical protein Ahy_A07g034953 [Arachis hypogaea]
MPETHTFILSVDEVTVTLEDIAHIFGLSIDGEVAEHRVFGNEPIVSSFSKSYIKLALVCRIRDAEPLDTLNSIQRYVKCQIFYLLGSTVFADKSTAYTHANGSTLIVGSSMSRASLQALCRATQYNCKKIDGSLNILFGHGSESCVWRPFRDSIFQQLTY